MTLEERRQREKDLRRENAVSAASKLFSSKGYERVTMDEIANEAELSKTTLYSYFKDKDSLLLAIVIRGSKIFRALLIEEEERIQEAEIKFGAVKNARERFALEYPEYSQCRIYFRSKKNELLCDKDKSENANEIMEFTKEFFEKGVLEINTGIENGILRSDINPEVLTALYMTLNDNMFAISPDLREIMNSKGINEKQFFSEVMHLMNCMILNREESETNLNMP